MFMVMVMVMGDGDGGMFVVYHSTRRLLRVLY
jgi:hypothetical protein